MSSDDFRRNRDYQLFFFQGPPFRNIDLRWWDHLQTHGKAKERLHAAEAQIGVTLYNDATTLELDASLISTFHRELFKAVFPDLAGRFRGLHPQGVPVNVEFGHFQQFSGARYEHVHDELADLNKQLGDLVSQLDQLKSTRSGGDLRQDVILAAAYTHHELIRIHPFPNGNGRVARICINYFLMRYGFLPIPIGRPEQAAYIEATQAWIEHRTVQPFATFLESVVVRNQPDASAEVEC